MNDYIVGLWKTLAGPPKTAEQGIEFLRTYSAKHPTRPCVRAALRICLADILKNDKEAAKKELEAVLAITGQGIEPYHGIARERLGLPPLTPRDFAVWAQVRKLEVQVVFPDAPDRIVIIGPKDPIPRGEFEIKAVATNEPSPLNDADLAVIGRVKSLTDCHFPLGGLRNRLTGQGIRHLSELTKLQNLQLDWANIGDEDLIHLKGMTTLKRLCLASTQVTGTGLRHLSKTLECLVLSNSVTDAGAAEVARFTNLSFLDLSNSPVLKDAGVRKIALLSKLDSINFGNNGASDESIAAAIRGWTNVSAVGIGPNRVGKATFAALAERPIKSLAIQGINVSPAMLESLKKMTVLERLSYRSDDLTKEQLQELKVAIPKCIFVAE